MLIARGDIDRTGTMNLRQLIPSDMTASAIAHLSLLSLLFLFSDVHPFGAVTAESIAVDIVAPQDIPEKPEIEKKPEPAPRPQPDFTALDKPVVTPAPDAPAPLPTAQQPPPAPKQKQATLAAPRPAPPPPAAPPQSQPAAALAPAYRQPEPDLTLKYNVLLGLPPDIMPSAPPAASPSSGGKAGDVFDAPATASADVASSVVAAFRRHLRTCSKLPATLKASDDVKVKLRVFMGQDGKLSAEPLLIEASASMKGPLLMQGAISALQACQPYAMLPVDRYGEWKVLDLSFTPQDFSGS
jgi:outer membrane biosynthesis protein TonB